MPRLPFVLLAALLVGGCTQQTTAENDFTGDEKAVAQVVLDLSDDAQRGRQADVCGRILSEDLQRKIAGDSSCDREVEKAFEDADALDLEVQKVTVSGTTADVTARGDVGGKQRTTTLEMVKEEGRWRAASFGTR